ncbi:arginine/serine-rich protein 1 [Larimichthys crocea]|uniref:arginine/serine-rich protein 1 n=1 Tax=Larimichthys crocea TaxID=215358 RepID=UPI000F5FE02A|nr:arginine/serine-rich protein 1 [Larimichthys crocea]
MAKVKESDSDMAHARQSDGISVIFDQKSPASSRSRSRSRSSNGSGSNRHRGRGGHRRHYRSSSSSSSRSRSSSNPRSRSHPRCHRRSSRCCCDNHRRYGRGSYRRSPPRHYRARSHSQSCSPSPDRYSRHRHYRSSSKSSSHQNRHRRADSRLESRPSGSPARAHRSRSKSRSSEHSVSLSLDDKRVLLEAAKSNAMKILGVEKLELPESVEPILTEQSESTRASPEPEMRVRQDPEKTPSQSSEVDPDDVPSPKMSPKRKTISFSINNSVVKPSVAAPSCAKVTPRVDIYDSRKPYGHWVRVKSGQTSKARKHTLATSH